MTGLNCRLVWNTQRLPKEEKVWMAAYFALKCASPSFNGAFKDPQLPVWCALIHRLWFLNCTLMIIQMVALLFRLQGSVSMIFKNSQFWKKFAVGHTAFRTVLHFFQSILHELRAKNEGLSGVCFSFLHGWILICISRWNNELHWQCFLEEFLSLCSNFRHRIMSVLNAALS